MDDFTTTAVTTTAVTVSTNTVNGRWVLAEMKDAYMMLHDIAKHEARPESHRASTEHDGGHDGGRGDVGSLQSAIADERIRIEDFIDEEALSELLD